MDEQIVPKHGDYLIKYDGRFAVIQKCNWRDKDYHAFDVTTEHDRSMTVQREPKLDTHKQHGWKQAWWWVQEHDRVPVSQGVM